MHTVNTGLVSLNEARRTLIPRRPDGRPINPSTLWRWIRSGLAGTNDERIRLEVTYVGSRPYVTRDALNRFFEAVTQARTATQPRSVNAASDAELAEAGLR